MKKLSIITICYNIKDEIERTCESIINQTDQDFEWIVVDGGSTDGTIDILNKYKHRMDVFISEPDKGIYNAMNKGIKLSTGTYLNFMNGGDKFIQNDVLEKIFKNKDYDADILYGNMCRFKKKKIIKRIYSKPINKKYFYNSCISHQSSFIKRDLFDKYGLYNENYRIVSDWEKWIVFAINNCKFQHLDLFVAIFDTNGISSQTSPTLIAERTSVHNKYFSLNATKIYIFGLPILKIENNLKGKKND